MRSSRHIASGCRSRTNFRVMKRKPHSKSRSNTLQTLHEDLSVVQSDDHGNQMQANSRTRDAGRVTAAEVTLEEVFAVTRGNPNAAVTHLYHQRRCLLSCNHLDGAPRRRVFDRVGNQIAKGM